MSHWIKEAVRKPLRALGYDIVNLAHRKPYPAFPLDFEPYDIEDFKAVYGYTMAPPERILTLRRAIEYVLRLDIPGAFIECGVWRGGCCMQMARVLLEHGVKDRDIYLFDGYDGEGPKREAIDIDRGEGIWDHRELGVATTEEMICTPNMVRNNMLSTGYPAERIHIVKGLVEDTIPEQAPEEIALLRLDTDFYSSVKHCLEELYPRLSRLGVLIIDDYGVWDGARKATDEYIAKHSLPILLTRVDSAAVMAVKVENSAH